MKKLFVLLAAVSVVGVLATGVSANPDAGQIVAEDFPCSPILDGNGNLTVTSTTSSITLYANKVIMKCSGVGAPYTGPNPPVVWNNANTGLICNVFGFGSTATWTDKVGRNGLSQLTCTLLGEFSAPSSSGGGAGLS